jgi:hypothetical protein
MKFWVATKDDTKLYDGTYTVLDNGVLVIHPENELHPITRLSPMFWREISEIRAEAHIVSMPSESTPSAPLEIVYTPLTENQDANLRGEHYADQMPDPPKDTDEPDAYDVAGIRYPDNPAPDPPKDTDEPDAFYGDNT